MMNKKISPKGLELIKYHEQLRLRVYLCPANKLTIGYGHVLLLTDYVMFKNMDSITLNRLITDCQRLKKVTKEAEELLVISTIQADALLNGDTRQIVNHLNSTINVDINQNQFDALCSLVFNIGRAGFSLSTLRKNLNNGDFIAAAAEFDRWVYATVNSKKQKLNGLVTRRAAERKLFEAL
jgi:lysozyme